MDSQRFNDVDAYQEIMKKANKNSKNQVLYTLNLLYHDKYTDYNFNPCDYYANCNSSECIITNILEKVISNKNFYFNFVKPFILNNNFCFLLQRLPKFNNKTVLEILIKLDKPEEIINMLKKLKIINNYKIF